ncbi:MAG: hypothetical protein MJZ34_13805 [Paludibacteraceae bacterium]|nr:hypothetical protein [Paludibacteraceae bacterium]
MNKTLECYIRRLAILTLSLVGILIAIPCCLISYAIEWISEREEMEL